MKTVKYKKVTMVLQWLFVLFLVGSGVGTTMNAPTDLAPAGTPLGDFVIALANTGYVFVWIGLFKIVAGIMLAIPKTRRLATLMLFGYTINILLYTIFVGTQFIPMAIAITLINCYLAYAYWDWYKPMFDKK